MLRILRRLDELSIYSIKEENNLPRRCAIDLSNILRHNVLTQNFPRPKRYTKRYREWKQEHGTYHIYWALFGDFVAALQPFRLGDKSWMAGIPSTAYDSGGKTWNLKGPRKRIAMYAHVMEYGGKWPGAGYHAPRPLFVPSFKEYRNGGALKQIDNSRKRMAQIWT